MFVYYLSPVDIDNNGFLDSNDFECMAVRACIIEGKGEFNPSRLAEYRHIMHSLWDEISDLADFDKVWPCMVMNGLLWFGIVLYGMVLYCIVCKDNSTRNLIMSHVIFVTDMHGCE